MAQIFYTSLQKPGLTDWPSAGGGDATVVSAVLQRNDGLSTTLSPWGVIPFSEAANVQPSQLDKLRVFVNGTEKRIGVAYPRGRHNNGGLISAVYRCEAIALPDATPITAEVWFGGTTARQTTDVSFSAPTSAEVLAGAPVVIPTDTAYLCASRLTMQPLLPTTSLIAEETGKFVTWKANYKPTLDAAYVTNSGGNYGQGAFYPICRAHLSSWCMSGSAADFFDGIRVGQYMYNLGSGFGETTAMIKQDFAIMHNMTTQVGFWDATVLYSTQAAFAPDGGGGLLYPPDAATLASWLPSRTYGFRFSIRGGFPVLGCVACDGKATGGPTFATKLPWIIDALLAMPWTEGDCTDGIYGSDSNSTAEGRSLAPFFQVAITSNFLIDYYNNVKADSRIPAMIKANVDAAINQFVPYTGSNGQSGADNDAYTAGATHGSTGANPMECPVTGNVESHLSHMWATPFAFTYSHQLNTVGAGAAATYLTWYKRVINQHNIPPSGYPYNTVKNWGEMGWSWAAPWYIAGNAPTGPSSIREPTSY